MAIFIEDNKTEVCIEYAEKKADELVDKVVLIFDQKDKSREQFSVTIPECMLVEVLVAHFDKGGK